jgi:V8-like Glu-specific endopeptidase
MKCLQTSWFVGCLMVGGLGCAVETQDEGTDPGIQRQAVIGGTTVNLTENADAALPYGVTVRFSDSKVGLSSGLSTCSGTKIGPKRYLTAAHCVDSWNGFSNGKVDISNHPSNAVDGVGSSKHELAAVFVHASWVIQGPAGAWIGRPLDVAMFDVKETNSIPVLAVNGVPKINTREITLGWWSRMVGYGSGRKLWGDNVSVTPTGDHPFMDEAAMKLNAFFWAGSPGGEPGDSGGPVFNELTGGWWISGIVSGAGTDSSQSRIVRAEEVRNWINNPAQPLLAGGSGGYLINARAPACMKASGTGHASQFACHQGTSSSGSQFWSLQSTGTTNRFRIRNGLTGRCLAVADNANGGHLLQQVCDTTNTNAGQKWDFVARGNLDQTGGNTAVGYSFYQIRSALGPSSRCLAPFNSTQSQGQLFHQYTCVTPAANPLGNDQVWAFTR